MRPIRARQSQQGAALTEFIAVAAVLVPVVLLIPVIGKVQDIRHATLMASRTAAFDATVHNDQGAGWKAHDTLANEVRQRHFGSMDSWVRSNQLPSDAAENRRSHWTTPHGQPLIASLSDIQVGFGDAAGADRAAAFGAASDGRLFDLNPFANAPRLGLSSRGLYTAGVSVPLVRLPQGVRAWQPLDQMDVTLRAHTTVLLDGWTARSPQQVEQRTAGLAPLTGGLSQAAVGLLGLPVELLELQRLSAPRIGQLEAWRDVVPTDRLTGTDRRPLGTVTPGGQAPSSEVQPNPSDSP